MKRRIQCPASRRAFSFGLLIGLLALSGCGYIPRPVAGVPPGAPWEALPLRKWLAENRAAPEALAFCAPPECSPGLVVSVVRLKGDDAKAAEAVLKDPDRLARVLRSPKDRKKKAVRTAVSVESLDGRPYPGFAISLAPADGGKPPAYGAAFGRRTGDELHVVLAIGEDPESVRATAREAAARELGS
ncbi:hypothetical protein [Microvirga lenta]|uniref:hypothetical protein n=1 Tax=Microvirga lenta TaxID=2881337 RepID=UPI001CFFAC15|nr:hypothetical protein [Microvirga lenta]MCB5177703.1 hypothetical protein [Microvirga lenta]